MRRAPTDGGLQLRSIIERAERLFPDRRVVTRSGDACSTLTYTELAARTRALASTLRGLGVGRGDRVATLGWNSHRHLELFFAVPSLGAVLEAVNPRFPPAEVERLLAVTRPRALFVDSTLSGEVPRLPGGVEFVYPGEDPADADGLRYENLIAEGDERFEFPDVDEDRPATMCFTSSTTGAPKAIQYSHRSLVLGTLVLNQPGVAPLREDDCVLAIVPLFHANAWGIPFAAMLSGADLVLPGPRPSGADLARLIAEERVTKAATVPTILDKLLAVPDADLSSLQEIYCAGYAPSTRLVRELEQRGGVRVVHAWGMTETGFFGFVSRPPAGVALSDAELAELALAQGREVPLLERRISKNGELQVRGPAVAGSYVDDAEVARYTPDGWLRTGDLATVVRNGFVQVVDRLQDTIKSGGEWIQSLALESLLRSFEPIADVAVVAAPDEHWGERPYAFVVPVAGESIDPDALRDFLAARVPGWWIPDQFELVESLARTPTGKVDKRAMRRSLIEDRPARRFRLHDSDRTTIAT